MRNVFGVPVPRVLAWSCDAANSSVKAEYIIEERMSGVRLGAVWPELSWRTKLAIVDQIVDVDSSLSAANFEEHGCLYFKEDLQRLAGHSETVHLTLNGSKITMEKYAMGPLTRAELWRNGRDQMKTDRGPCKS